MRSEVGKISLDTVFKEREQLNVSIVGSLVYFIPLKTPNFISMFQQFLQQTCGIVVVIYFAFWAFEIDLFEHYSLLFL